MLNTDENKKTWISVANVFACIGVLVLHCDGIYHTFPQGRLWYTSSFLQTLFYWPVPVFFMITGATLINYRNKYSTAVFLKKRIRRTVVPFLCWSIIWMLECHFVGEWSVGGIKGVIEGIINTTYNSVYWFFIPLFSIYLSMPLLSAINRELRNSVFLYIVVVTFIFTSVLPVTFSLLGMQYNSGLQVAVSGGGYVLWVLLGYLIAQNDILPRYRYLSYILAIIGSTIQYFGTTALSFADGALNSTLKGYNNFPAVLQGVGVFIAFKYIPWEKILKKGKYLFLSMSKYTFGVYLIHMFFVSNAPVMLGIDTASILWRIGGAVLIFIICEIICVGISKIPVLKRIIGL